MKWALSLLLFCSSFSASAALFTREEIRQVLFDRNLSPSQINEVIRQLENPSTQEILPISGYLTTSGRNATVPWARVTKWKNVTITFKEDSSQKMISTDCLYDMNLRNGGPALSFDYRKFLMFVIGEQSAGDLDGAVYGQGAGFNWTFVVGGSLNYLPANNRNSSMFLVTGQFGWGIGVNFPTIEFSRTQSCPTPH